MSLTKERADLAEIVDSATTAVRRLFASKALYLRSDLPQDLPPILCDRTRIREVLLNLLSNAARFTEKGGVDIRVKRENGTVVVAVADTGPGIPPHEAKRLFRPFEQLDSSFRRRGGSGLGLSISKALVELHGGQMWVESKPGEGTTVLFRLPISTPMPLQGGVVQWLRPEWEYRQRTGRPLVSPAPVRPRVLVVETGDDVQRLLARYMDNVDIVSASVLEQALAEAAHTPTQMLIVNDLLVGPTLQRLSGSAAAPVQTPVVICSLPERADAAQALGVAGYLVKPVTRDQLLAALDGVHPDGGTVLVVDDDPEALHLFARLLRAAGRGYRVFTAANGAAALRILRRHKPDVMLLDLIMPGMDGFRVLRAMKEAGIKDTRVVIMSARDPYGQPLVCNAVAVTKREGLSVQQLLAIIDALRTILSPGCPPADQGLPTDRVG